MRFSFPGQQLVEGNAGNLPVILGVEPSLEQRFGDPFAAPAEHNELAWQRQCIWEIGK